MRQKILVAMHYMELGGAEAALLGLLQSVDPERAEVDVMIYSHQGELMHYVQSEELGVRSSQPLKRLDKPWREDEALAEGSKSEEYSAARDNVTIADGSTPPQSQELQELCDTNPAMQELIDTFDLVEVSSV